MDAVSVCLVVLRKELESKRTVRMERVVGTNGMRPLFSKQANHRSPVPHPDDVFVLVVRVGYLDRPLACSSRSPLTTTRGCPIQTTSLFLSFGWDTSTPTPPLLSEAVSPPS